MKSLIRSHSPLALFSLAMVALMCVLPFLVPIHRNPLTTFYGEWLAAALGLSASLLLLRPKSWQPFQFPLVALVPLGLIVVLGIQVWAGLAVYWQHHFLVGLYLLWAALLVVLGAELRREFGLEKIVPVLAWVILAGGLLCSLIVILQAAGVENAYIVPRKAAGYGANLMQVNHLANYLGLALGSLLYLAGTGRLRHSISVVLALLLLFPLALTGQRMGWIYVVMLSVGAWLAGRKSNVTSWRALWLIPGFIAMQLLIPLLASEMAGMFRLAGVPPMPAQKVIEGFQGSSVRLQLYQEAWQVFLAHPWVGAGWRQFGWQDFLMAASFPDHQGWYHHAHNLVLHLMAETGLAGTLLVVGGIGFWLYAFVRQRFTAERWWLLGLVAVLGVHSLLEYPLWYGYFLGIAALLIGLGSEKSFDRPLDLGSLVLAGVVLFGMLSLFNLATHYRALESWHLQARDATKDVARFEEMLRSLQTIGQKSLLTPQVDLLLARALPREVALDPALRPVSRKAMVFAPQGWLVYRQSLLLALENQPKDALHTLRLAIIRHPDGLSDFEQPLVKMISPQTLPLINEIIRHNRSELGMKPIPEYKLAP